MKLYKQLLWKKVVKFSKKKCNIGQHLGNMQLITILKYYIFVRKILYKITCAICNINEKNINKDTSL